MKQVFFLASFLLAFAPCAFAAKTEQPLKAANKADFEKVVAQIREEMKPNGRFGELSAQERTSVDGDLKQMSDLFDKTPDVAAMSDNDKRALFNAQEAANATLLKRDGDRLICTRETRSGTHFPTTTCRTAREIERDRRGSQDWMQRNSMQQPNNYSPGGSGGR